jgi:hypothetical protein
MSRVGIKLDQLGEVRGFDSSHGEKVVEFFITQSFAADSACDPLCNFYAELMGVRALQQ